MRNLDLNLLTIDYSWEFPAVEPSQHSKNLFLFMKTPGFGLL